MRYPRLRLCLAGCAFFLASTSNATSYDIDTTEDAPVEVERVEDGGDSGYRLTASHLEDGKCSLREALVAINYQIEVDSCEAGTGTDTISLQEDTVYTLTEGQLTVGGGKQVTFESQDEDDDSEPTPNPPSDDKPINVNVRLVLALESFEEADDKIKPVIITEDNARLFNVKESARQLSLENLTLKADEDSAPSDGNGGLIRSDSDVALGEGMLLQGGSAANHGGAIYLDENANLVFNQDARFLDNRAAKGAAIATSATFEGDIVGERFYMAGNETGDPNGGVIYLNGEPSTLVSLGMSNGTISNNSGGAIRVVADEYQAVFQNLTLAFNDGAALDMEESQYAPQGNGDFKPVQIYNTALIGNDKGCEGDALKPTLDNATLLFTITDDASCPTPEEMVQVTTSPNDATSDVLIGADSDGNRQVCDSSAKGKGGCQPLLPEAIGGNLPAFIPNPEPTGLDPGDPEATASLFDRGNPEDAAQDQCAAKDVRGKDRGGPGGRCDVGAVEFLRALGEQVEVELISGGNVLADVLANDRNDTQVDCERVGEPCMEILVPPARGVATVQYRCKNLAGEAMTEASEEYPDNCPADSPRVYPYIHYTPDSDFHGVDRGMRYLVPSAAFIGGVDQGQDVNETVNFVAAPESGLTDSSGIGAAGGVSLLLLAVAGLLRRFSFALRVVFSVVALTLFASSALAADIKVDSLEDPENEVEGNGECTLRKALQNANNVNPSKDCEFGDKGEDRILLPAGTITLNDPLEVRGAVVFEGQGAHDADTTDDDDTLTVIKGKGDFRLFNVRTQVGRAYPSVTFRFLKLSDGQASATLDDGNGGVLLTGGTAVFDHVVVEGNHADGNGGVIHLLANAGNKKTVRFENSYVTGNSAGGNGGVFYSVAQNEENITLEVINSTFANNQAGGDGGVLDASLAQGSLDVINSTFVGNAAQGQGSVLALNGLAISRARLLNLTFSDNSPGFGIELGETETSVVLSHSILAGSGGACTSSTSSGAAMLSGSFYNLFADSACAADNEEANTVDSSAVLAASLEGEEGSTSDYVPPHLPVADPTGDLGYTPDPLVINQGNDDELASGSSSPERCRRRDVRGIERTSGGICDRGAVEYQQITANDDSANNTETTPDRRVLINLLDNDLPSDGAEIGWLDDDGEFQEGRFTFEDARVDDTQDEAEATGNGKQFAFNPTADHPTRYTLNNPAVEGEPTLDVVWRFYNEERDGFDVACGEPLPQVFIDSNSDDFEDGDLVEDCAVLYDAGDTIASKTDNSSPSDQKQVCPVDDDPDWQPAKVAFVYTFKDSEGEESESASAIMTISNRPPALEAQSLLNKPGKRLVFELSASDPDGEESSIDWSTLAVPEDGKPKFTQTGEDRNDVLGVGLLLNTPSDGQVTYIPEGNFNTFKDTFKLTVEDECGSKSNTATFTVRYPEQSAAGGDLGGAGWSVLGMLLLLGRRWIQAG